MVVDAIRYGHGTACCERSGIVDALSTVATDETQVKILAWYDNEWGYANRPVELARMVAGSLPADQLSAGSASTSDG